MKVVHLARKPLTEPSVASNVFLYGTSALNIDAGRIPTAPGDEVSNHGRSTPMMHSTWDVRMTGVQIAEQTRGQKLGRAPSNVVLEHLASCTKTKNGHGGWVCSRDCPVGGLRHDVEIDPTRFYKQVGR